MLVTIHYNNIDLLLYINTKRIYSNDKIYADNIEKGDRRRKIDPETEYLY